MTLNQMDPKPGKKLHLQKETVKDFKLGNRAAGYPCYETDLDDPEEFETAAPPKAV